MGATAVRRALVEAAARRFAAEGPDASLRDIADDAGVNLGLIHRHVGNKDDLLRAVLDHEVDRGVGTITGATDVGEALRRMLEGASDDGRYVRIVAGLLLKDPSSFRHQDRFPGMRALRDLPDPGGPAPDRYATAEPTERDARLMLAMAALYGWTVFGPQLRASFGADPADEADLVARLGDALVALATSPTTDEA